MCQTAVAFEESRIPSKEGAGGAKGGDNLARQCADALKACQDVCREIAGNAVKLTALESTLVKVVSFWPVVSSTALSV